jgi:hypothetical protein
MLLIVLLQYCPELIYKLLTYDAQRELRFVCCRRGMSIKGKSDLHDDLRILPKVPS